MKLFRKIKCNRIIMTLIITISLMLLLSSSAFAIYLARTIGEKKLALTLKLFVEPQGGEQPVINPQLVEGMIPVVWNTTDGKWQVTTADDPTWFSYTENEKRWANVMMPDGTNSTYSVGTEIEDSDLGSMFVWIPRYEYKIHYYTDNTKTTISDIQTNYGSIDIQFIRKSQTAPDQGYIIHPAFRYGYTDDFKNGEWGAEIAGLWFAKFETTDSPQIRPNTYTTSKIDVSTMYTNARSKTFGLASLQAHEVNPHMIKNSEWGAMAYLSYSEYGLNGENVHVNNYFQDPKTVSGYYATAYNSSGNMNGTYNSISYLNYYSSDLGKKGSTTWNIYGVYDTVGGRTEYIAGYLIGMPGNSQFITDGGTKYCTPYEISTTGNAEETIKNTSVVGDAVGETYFWNNNAVGLANGSGNTPTANLVSLDRPCMARGGAATNGKDGGGLMSFWTLASGSSQYRTTREVLIIE